MTATTCIDIRADERKVGIMSQVVNVNFKLDSDVKKSMEQACADMGLSMSAAFTIFAKKVGRERRIPFEISADPEYLERDFFRAQSEEELLARIDRSLQQIKAGKYSDAAKAGERIRSEYGL